METSRIKSETKMVDEIKETYVLYTKFGDDKGEVEKLLAAGVL